VFSPSLATRFNLPSLLKTQLCYLTNSVTMEKEYQFVYSGTSVRPSDHPTPSKGIFQLVPWSITSEHPIANIAGQTGYQARILSNQDGSSSCSNHIHALCDSHFGFRCEDTFIVTLPTSLLVQVPHKRLF